MPGKMTKNADNNIPKATDTVIVVESLITGVRLSPYQVGAPMDRSNILAERRAVEAYSRREKRLKSQKARN
uniref:Uncharacterized protein n=1 Tax=Romanomermis culicivorax TaxID=13658 RepID=A0A915JZK4_ROMCU